MLGLLAHMTEPGFYIGAEDLNSGLLAFTKALNSWQHLSGIPLTWSTNTAAEDCPGEGGAEAISLFQPHQAREGSVCSINRQEEPAAL